MGGKPSGDRLESADIERVSDWSQKGAFWVRKADGPYAQCHMDHRAGAHVLWRDHAESYCCDGFPYFSTEHVRKMQGGMEVFKPLLRVEVSSARAEFALARSIADPHGLCWGLSTLREWLEMRSWDALVASPSRWDGWAEVSQEEILARLKSMTQTTPCEA